MIRRLGIPLIFLLASASSLHAQTGIGNLEFIRNKGQWDTTISFRANINNGAFFLQKKGFTVLLHDAADMERVTQLVHGHAVLTQATKAPKAKATFSEIKTGKQIIHHHSYRVQFLNTSSSTVIAPDKPLDTYNNYFIGNDRSKWAAHCDIYQAIIYQNIYQGIDVRYYTDNGTLKYDLIVHPGANPDQIAMKYDGQDKLLIEKNQLIIKTSVGDVKELEPSTFQTGNNARSAVSCSYVVEKNNTVHFRLGKYDHNATLIIDPTLIFSTFTGSHSDNWGYTATYDAAGNFYAGGIVVESENDDANGYLYSPGAFQTSFQGGDATELYHYDIGIMKFNSTGSKRLYGTYLGGSGDEQPHSLFVDGDGNLIVAGRTSSKNYPSYPASKKQFSKGGDGDFEIFITKLNATGTALIGSLLIGGRQSDGLNIKPKYPSGDGAVSLRLNYGDDGRSEVIADKAGNIYLASCTQSDSFYVTPNAMQKRPGGKQDGVLVKVDKSVSTVLYSSYFGGSEDDAAFVLSINPLNGNVYIAGGTASTNIPGTTSGPVLFSTSPGGIHGYVAIVSPAGALVKSTYLRSSDNGTDMVYGVQFDKHGFPYVMGTTTGTWPIINAAFSQPKGRQFISKLQPDLSSYVYSTVFGKGSTFPDISPTAFLVDKCENVYVAGWGGGIDVIDRYPNSTTSGLTTTADAIQKTTDGDDFYFFVLQKNAASQLYGSFFGQVRGELGDHVDGGTSRYDQNGIIYQAICANCYGGATFPTTPGVWERRNGTGRLGCNEAAVKIAFNFAGVVADVRAYINDVIDTAGCNDVDITFKDLIAKAKFYIWNYDTANHTLKKDTTTDPTILHKYPTKGVYTVQLVAIDSATCNVADTAYVTVKIGDIHANLLPSAAVVGDCRNLNYQFKNLTTTSRFHPNPPFTDSSFIWDFGDGTILRTGVQDPPLHHFPAPGTYNVKLTLIDTNYCNSPETSLLQVSVAQYVRAAFTAPFDACVNQPVAINNTSRSSQQYAWDFGNGQSSTDANPLVVYTDTGAYTIKLLATDTTTCNKVDSAFAVVHVHGTPTAAFTITPTVPQVNTPTVFYNSSLHAVKYEWIFGDGSSVVKTNMDTTVHQYQRTKTFNACLVAFNEYGCTDTVCHPVEALINPLLDIPNAFTPGRFGVNGIVSVRGFGIQDMRWRIYNRWGQVVFESFNPEIGWDGTFKGVPQPMDVYAYVLEVQYFDGTKVTRKGDITLIR